ncbi:unnamed protein product, partial [Meganyctiphanes norvegica]
MVSIRSIGIAVFSRLINKRKTSLTLEWYWNTSPQGQAIDYIAASIAESPVCIGLKGHPCNVMPEKSQCLKYEVRGRPKVVIYWLAELLNPNTPVVMSSEHQDFKWLPLKEACNLSKFPDMIRTLNESEQLLSQNEPL